MKYQVEYSHEAEEDLWKIGFYIARNDSLPKAEWLVDSIEKLADKLAYFPLRGHVTPELALLGVLDYREIHFKPYRIIYQVLPAKVIVHAVLDGRRSIQELLRDRLIKNS
ncbi:MAG: type II toxin-antitoxin system RelE/ParE family toxin [Deltaproteobacteria bacterium]|nr:type II toxin-antitoxin system RelE/ParE family toxin [Deltaproteobacteria bacterium]